MNINKNTIIYIKNISFLKKINENNLLELLNSSTIRSLKKDEILFFEGDRAKNLYIILDGSFKLYNETMNGSESIKRLLTSGDFFGECSLLENNIYKSNAESTRYSRILEISTESLKKVMNKDSNTGNIILYEILNNQYKLEHQIEYLSVMNATQRIGWYLIDILAKNKSCQNKINLQHDKSLIATFLGMKPETFSRSIKKLRKADVHVNGAEIIVNDFNLLQKYCADKIDNLSDRPN